MKRPGFTLHQGDHDELVVVVDQELRDTLGDALGTRGFIAGDENTHITYCRDLLDRVLNERDKEVLWRVMRSPDNQGIVVFENLPFEAVEWSPVPGAPAHSAKASSLSEHLLLAISSYAGDAYGVHKEGSRLVNDLIPSQSDMQRLTGNGSKVELGLHYENAALRFARAGFNLSPLKLLLTGVSKQPFNGPETMVASSSLACQMISDASYQVLRSPCVKIALPVRQRTNSESDWIGPAPVILGSAGNEEIVGAFYGDMLVPLNDDAKVALGELKNALEEVAFGVRIEPGRMVCISNGRALHGRSAFEPLFDDLGRAKRWIQRVFVTERLDAFADFKIKSERVFDVNL